MDEIPEPTIEQKYKLLLVWFAADANKTEPEAEAYLIKHLKREYCVLNDIPTDRVR